MSDTNNRRMMGPLTVKCEYAKPSIRPLLVGVTGGTGAGKTTFARRLAKIMATRQAVTLVDLDSYYKDFSFLSLPERQSVNFDDPDSVDLVRFREDLDQLRRGQAIVKPVYDLVTYRRHTGGPIIAPGNIVVVEGLMLFVNESIRSLFNVRIYIDTPAEVRLRRRLERDMRERGRTLAGAIDHYMSSVLPIHDRYIEPAKGFSDFVIPGWQDTEHNLSEVALVIQNSSNNFTVEPSLAFNHSQHEVKSSFPVERDVSN